MGLSEESFAIAYVDKEGNLVYWGKVPKDVNRYSGDAPALYGNEAYASTVAERISSWAIPPPDARTGWKVYPVKIEPISLASKEEEC